MMSTRNIPHSSNKYEQGLTDVHVMYDEAKYFKSPLLLAIFIQNDLKTLESVQASRYLSYSESTPATYISCS